MGGTFAPECIICAVAALDEPHETGNKLEAMHKNAMTKNTASLETQPLVPVDAPRFREGMSRLAAAVNLVTTDGKAGRAGLTATAVTSVTDAPATLIICVNSLSHAGLAIEENGVFAVNVLAAGKQDFADAFGGPNKLPGDKRFDLGQWVPGPTGSPLLVGALASFDCRIVGSKVVATHRVVFGEVVDVRLGQPEDPLLYFQRHYRSLGEKR